ncbi:MAG: ATP-dependent RNA helicase rhle, ATP-dependent RNA helicase RhlE [Deltaproteobacteria bacterium CSP1-8]|nr:MAG: ATP-dependent RNA helicase rhle, ATP-dependent RNA helicase RhlE [Deltaproteobacteria bacterium CSP1-8]
MTFSDFGFSTELLRAVRAKNYTVPTPIQEKAIPHVLSGKDLLGCAQTGTGKTAAFALPILQKLGQEGGQGQEQEGPHPGRKEKKRAFRPVRALVLTPTRELATQIGESFREYGRHTGLRQTTVYGGVSQVPQERALREGVDIVVATPGRLLDLMSQGLIRLGAIEIFVLDEADRMLDMGFIHDIRRLVDKLPPRRQSLFFSATIPGDIRRLADTILRDPVRVTVSPQAPAPEAVEHYLYLVEKPDKAALLQHLLADPALRNVLVFTRTRHGADRVARHLARARIPAEAIHGDKTQRAREQALSDFRRGKSRVLVATDIAARGLDIVGLSHVVNYDLPNEPESYVHRTGRTGRAGLSGIALSFCDIGERPYLPAIEQLLRKHLKVVEDHPHRSGLRPGSPTDLEPRKPRAPRPFMISVEELFGGARREGFAG